MWSFFFKEKQTYNGFEIIYSSCSAFGKGRLGKQHAEVPSDAVVLFQHAILSFVKTILFVLHQNNFNDRCY